MISTTLGVSPSSAHAAVIPTTGTSSDIGATRLAGYFESSMVHSPEPATVPSSTV